jgi:hypothetical protein
MKLSSSEQGRAGEQHILTLLLALIHQSAWKANSQKFGCSIPYSLAPSGRGTGSSPSPTHSSRHYILWCWMDMQEHEYGPPCYVARNMAEDSSGRACRYLPVVATEACPRVAFTRWTLAPRSRAWDTVSDVEEIFLSVALGPDARPPQRELSDN